MNAFLSRTRRLLGDRAFILSAGLSMAATVLFISMAVYLIGRDKINITKIADMSVVSINTPIERKTNTNRLSDVYQLVNVDLSTQPISTYEMRALKAKVWAGFLVKLDTFCKIGYAKDQKVGVWVGGRFTPLEVDTVSNVIVKTSDRTTAGIIKFGPRTCEIAKNLNGNEQELAENKTRSNGEQIYVVSDKPFEETESIPVEFAISSIDR
jgi:hypothetical protein